MISFLVEDWMMGCGLGLGGYEMPIFAYAYSFFREGKTLFASEGSIAALMGCSRKQAGIILKRLCEKGLLIRSETKHPEFQTYSYSVCEEKVRSFVTPGCEETSQGDAKKVPTQMGRNVTSPCNLTSHNNDRDKYMDNSIDIVKKEPVKRINRYANNRSRVLDVGHPEDFSGPNIL